LAASAKVDSEFDVFCYGRFSFAVCGGPKYFYSFWAPILYSNHCSLHHLQRTTQDTEADITRLNRGTNIRRAK